MTERPRETVTDSGREHVAAFGQRSTTASPPGSCGMHGYHGCVTCPRCSTSAIPPARLSTPLPERTFNALQHAESWRLVERYCERYPSDWRLVFKRGDEVLEVSVPEEVWRAFDR